MAQKSRTIHLTEIEIRALKDSLESEIYNLENEEHYQWQRNAFLAVMKKLGYVQDKLGFWVSVTDIAENRARISNLFGYYKSRMAVIDPEEVTDYIMEQSGNLDAYINIITKIIKLKEKYFGFPEQSQLVLQINHDPEIDNPFPKFYVRKNEYDESFMTNIDKLQEECFGDLHESNIWILVTTDFKKCGAV
jgi:hypothetical protein